MKNTKGEITLDGRQKEDKAVYVVITAILIFFLTINTLTPMMGEDFILVAWPQDYTATGVWDLLQKLGARIYDQMTGFNARLGEQLAIICSCLSKPVFNILNSLMALYYLWLMQLYAFGSRDPGENVVLRLLVGFSMIILLHNTLGDAFFWRDGSANYLWALCFLLTFGLPIRCYTSMHSRDIIGKSIPKTIFWIILGFFAGFTNENTVFMFAMLYAGVIVVHLIKKRPIPVWLYGTFISLMIGYVMLLTAPSTIFRIHFYREIFDLPDPPTISNLIQNIPMVIARFWKDEKSMVLVTATIILLGLYVHLRGFDSVKERKWEAIRQLEPFGYLMLTALSCGVLVASPYIETRSFMITCFMMEVCTVYYSDLLLKKLAFPRLTRTLSVVLVAATLPCIFQIYKTYYEYHDFCVQREAELRLSRDGLFYWGEYYGPRYSRILTTREDYLDWASGDTSVYFGKSIKKVQNYIHNGNIHISGYQQRSDAEGYYDYLHYDREANVIDIWGWVVIPGIDSTDCEVLVYLETDGEKYYYKVNSVERADVAEVLGNKKYLNSGYSGRIETFGPVADCETPEMGLCVINRKKKVYQYLPFGVVVPDDE